MIPRKKINLDAVQRMMPQGGAMKIAVYARVSTRKQDNDNQLLQLREFAEKQGWHIVAEYVDVVTGSGKKDRARFEALLLAASQKKVDLILFWKLDRFSREGTRATLHLLTILDTTDAAGVPTWSRSLTPGA